MKKYEIHNQLTGLSEEVNTFVEALELQKKIRLEYCDYCHISEITIMLQQEDGSWSQGNCDENGELITPVSVNLKNI